MATVGSKIDTFSCEELIFSDVRSKEEIRERLCICWCECLCVLVLDIDNANF